MVADMVGRALGDEGAVFQHHTVLLFIERDILLLRVRRAVEMVDQTVDDLAAEYGLL